MLKNLTFLIISLMLAGCWGKSSLHSDANLKNELLAYTQKHNSAEILLVTTYLNPIYQGEFTTDMQDFDTFIVSIYPQNLTPKSVTINSINATLTKLEKDDKLSNLVSMTIPWSNYYKATIPTQKSNILSVNITLDNNTTATLNFQKVARSLYWHTR